MLCKKKTWIETFLKYPPYSAWDESMLILKLYFYIYAYVRFDNALEKVKYGRYIIFASGVHQWNKIRSYFEKKKVLLLLCIYSKLLSFCLLWDT